MKRFITYATIFIFIFALSLGFHVGIVAGAENEITIESITKVNASGASVAYDGDYSRDVTINYSFLSANSFYVKVYKKEGATFNEVGVSATKSVVDGKGTYLVVDSGELRLDCIALDIEGDEIGSLSVQVKSDVVAPLAPSLDVDGAFLESHAEAFNVSYIINYDEISGVDFTRSTYNFKDTEGNEIIEETLVKEGYDKALVRGINQNGTLTFTIYDNAGNFVVISKNYNLHYYVDSTAPNIVVTPSVGYSPNVMVTLSWPQGVNHKYYKIIANGIEQARTPYTVPLSITQEGTVEIRAYYYENGEETYVSKTIDNVDNTPPNSKSIAESIGMKVDLTSNSPATLSLRVLDGKSGVKRVYLKNFGTEFAFSGLNTYSLDVTSRLGLNVTIVAEDFAGNKVEYNYPLNGYDKEKIVYYSNTFKTLEQEAYDAVAWSNLMNEYSRLSNLLSSASSTSGDINAYAKALDNAISGKHEVRVAIVDVIDGLINDFKAEIGVNNSSVKKGGKIDMSVKKIDVNEGELNEKISVGAAIAKFPAYQGYGFNLSLTDREGNAVVLHNQMSVSLTIPGANKLAKVYCEKDGILLQLSSTIENNVLTFQTESQGNFYLIVETDVPKEQVKGLTIGGKFYPMNLLLITGGIMLGAMVLVGIITPIIYKVVKNRKNSRKKFDYLR